MSDLLDSISVLQRSLYRNNALVSESMIFDSNRFFDPKRLLRYQCQINSQNGEDGMIHEIFKRIGTTNQVFVEVGIGDGSEIQNNTAFLFSQGWTGFWIDSNSKAVEQLYKLNKESNSKALKGCVAFTSRENIETIFQKLEVPIDFDFMSLDIDMNTYYLWEGLKKYNPRVVMVEYNAAIPSDLDWKVHYDPQREWDGSQNFGASLKAFENLGNQMGYSLVGCDITGVNAFFVRSDLIGNYFCEPCTAENHWEPIRYAFRRRYGHPSGVLDRIEK